MDGERLLVFGMDGADWAYVEPLIARGLMPNLARLRAEGAWGPLQSMKPTDSPVIWTTIATGQPPQRHGVRGFLVSRMRRVQAPLRRIKPIRLLGYQTVADWLAEQRVLFEAPVSSLSRREPALWNLMADAGRPVSLLNWWVTWPAEPVVGRVVSERLYYWRFAQRGWGPESEQLTHPPGLAAEIAGEVVPPDAIQYEQAREFVDVDRAEFDRMMKTAFSKHMLEGELRYFLSMYETNRRVARRLVEMDRRQYGRAADLLVLERLVDMACHAALAESELVEDHLGVSAERQRKFGRVITAAYAAVDRQLGELLQAYGDGNVIVLSDHGFHLVSHWPDWNRTYGHGDAPSGIFVARGPAFTPGRVDGLSVYDVFPLLARLKGLPVADDLAGRIPEEVLSPSARARPITRVARYGAAAPVAEGDAAADDREMMERLRALGYVQ
jgi:predicted AlkP superfamily phosphohydrolase/phosphomutase